MSYTYTPTPSRSPSSLEAWRNKPKRVEGWSKTLPPRTGEPSWGKGVGVGSAEWSGTTGNTGWSGPGGVGTRPIPAATNGVEDEGGQHVGDKTDGGTEPTTFKNGRLAKNERASEVVREQRRLGSQGSTTSKSAPHLSLGQHFDRSLDVPIIIPAPANNRRRPSPTPFLALPTSHPHPTSIHPSPSAGPSRPIPVRSAGSDISAQSAHSARSVRDAFIESALHIPIDLLAEVQAEKPHRSVPTPASAGEPVRKSKSNVGQRASARIVSGLGLAVAGGEVRKAKSGGGGGVKVAKDVKVSDQGKRNSRVPLEPVKTWPSAKPRISPNANPIIPSIPQDHKLPARTSSTQVRHPHTSTPALQPILPHVPSRVPSPIPHPPPSSPAHLRPTLPVAQLPQPLRPALSRTGASFDAFARTLGRGRSRQTSLTGVMGPGLQTRFEPSTYPLPMSGTTTSRDLSPVRPYVDERGRSLGSTNSHKGKIPIRIELEDATLTPGSSTDRRLSYDRDTHHTHPPHTATSQPGSSRRQQGEITMGPSTHLRVTQSNISPGTSNHSRSHAGETTGGGGRGTDDPDRISFEIPSSGTRGRLRVSLAWFKDVGSPRRWRERSGMSPRSSGSEVPPPLPSKDPRWARGGGRSPIPLSPQSPQSPRRGDRHHRANRAGSNSDRSPPQSRPRSPIDHRPDRSHSRERGGRRDFLVPPERERDKVRFSPLPPHELRSPTTTGWPPPPPPSLIHNPYLQPNGPMPYLPSATFPQRQGQPYPYVQPIPQWPGPGTPFNPYGPAIHPHPPMTQVPGSPGGSLDSQSGGSRSPRGYNQPLPPFYPSTPHLPPQLGPLGQPYPGPTGFGYGGAGAGTQIGQNQGVGNLPWSGRPTMWQRMFQPRNDEGPWDAEGPRRPDMKEGWIRNWRSGVGDRPGDRGRERERGGTTIFGSGGDTRVGYGGGRDGQERGRGWLGMGMGMRGRQRGADTVYPVTAVGEQYRPDRRRPLWGIGNRNNRTEPTRIGQTGYPQVTYPTSRLGGTTGIFSRNPRTNLGQNGPLSSFRTGDRDKNERRAQRKERRDRRDGDVNGLGGRTTIHPFDSITRVGVPETVMPVRPLPRLGIPVGQRVGGGGGGGGRVGDWVKRVSVNSRNLAPAGVGVNGRTGGAGGIPWRDRLKARGGMAVRPSLGQAGGVGAGGGTGGKLRRGDSGRSQRQGVGTGVKGGLAGLKMPFNLGRGGGAGARPGPVR